MVVGVDGSEASKRALVWAANEARLRGAALRVVHAWGLPILAYSAGVPAELLTDVPAEAYRSLDADIAEVLGDHTELVTEREIGEGPPAQVILDHAKGADLVVVGSRGRGGFAGLLLGSVSSQVVHHAACPVTVVHP